MPTAGWITAAAVVTLPFALILARNPNTLTFLVFPAPKNPNPGELSPSSPHYQMKGEPVQTPAAFVLHSDAHARHRRHNR